MKPLLIAMVGLPRSGKSTISRELAKKLGAPIVNRDAIRLALHGQRFEAKAEPMVKAISQYMIEALFLTGHEVVIVDETNYSKAARNAMRSSKWETRFYPVPTDPETCIQRAYATNQADLELVIRSMWARNEPLEKSDLIYEAN